MSQWQWWTEEKMWRGKQKKEGWRRGISNIMLLSEGQKYFWRVVKTKQKKLTIELSHTTGEFFLKSFILWVVLMQVCFPSIFTKIEIDENNSVMIQTKTILEYSGSPKLMNIFVHMFTKWQRSRQRLPLLFLNTFKDTDGTQKIGNYLNSDHFFRPPSSLAPIVKPRRLKMPSSGLQWSKQQSEGSTDNWRSIFQPQEAGIMLFKKFFFFFFFSPQHDFNYFLPSGFSVPDFFSPNGWSPRLKIREKKKKSAVPVAKASEHL